VLFNRLELIKAAQDTIAAENAALERAAAEKNAQLETAHAEWIADYREPWLAALARVRKKLRNGQPLYADDFPSKREWRGSIAIFGDRPRAYHQAGTFNSPDLNNLIAVLSTIEDETVTPSGLRAIGVTSGALSAALRTLGRTKNEGN